jgi:hypothetical protein
MEELQPQDIEDLLQELEEEGGACRFEQRRAYGQQI